MNHEATAIESLYKTARRAYETNNAAGLDQADAITAFLRSQFLIGTAGQDALVEIARAIDLARTVLSLTSTGHDEAAAATRPFAVEKFNAALGLIEMMY